MNNEYYLRPATDKEAFEIWFSGYAYNYGHFGLLESKQIAEAAWTAALEFINEQYDRHEIP